MEVCATEITSTKARKRIQQPYKWKRNVAKKMRLVWIMFLRALCLILEQVLLFSLAYRVISVKTTNFYWDLSCRYSKSSRSPSFQLATTKEMLFSVPHWQWRKSKSFTIYSTNMTINWNRMHFCWNMFLLTPFCENDHKTRNTLKAFPN
jgi:hypothetical protein